VCPGDAVTVTATATNCSQQVEDIDLFIDFGLAGSFAGVQPGASVVASRTIVQGECSDGIGTGWFIGALARNAACPAPFGSERTREADCIATECGTNRGPNCDAAHPSVARLWPPDGRMVPVSIEGVTDPDGDPIHFDILVVGSDEGSGVTGQNVCPDAVVPGDGTVELRAERDPLGNGRWYLIGYEASDTRGARCLGQARVYVPRKEDGDSVDPDGSFFNPLYCQPVRTGNRDGGGLVPTSENGGIGLRFATGVEQEVRLEVYDVRGRRLATLIDARVAAGNHDVRWDGIDASGRRVGAGIYMFRLRIGTDIQTVKAALVR
jgi:FlgD Ig-like domain